MLQGFAETIEEQADFVSGGIALRGFHFFFLSKVRDCRSMAEDSKALP